MLSPGDWTVFAFLVLSPGHWTVFAFHYFHFVSVIWSMAVCFCAGVWFIVPCCLLSVWYSVYQVVLQGKDMELTDSKVKFKDFEDWAGCMGC